MPSTFETLIGQIADAGLRSELQAAASDLLNRTDFGLVYEAHLPETLRLPDHPIRRGVKVGARAGRDKSAFEVVRVNGNTVIMRRVRHPDGTALTSSEQEEVEVEEVERDSLIVVAEFGDPIYPGLRHLGGIARGGEKPAHVVISGENHHALEALEFTHAGKIDCIYIDPPYNTGEPDWKYSNDYVDGDDAYRHSKWLAFMEHRLKLAKTLLNPDNSVLICAIDEKEYLRLGLLLEQLFPQCTVQMVSTVVKPEGTGRFNEFSRTNEYLFFVMQGEVAIAPGPDNMYDRDGSVGTSEIEWRNLRRREKTSKRGSRPNQFYAVFVDEITGRIHSVGDPLTDEVLRGSIPVPAGTRPVFPLTPGGVEMLWGLVPSSLRYLVENGYARTNGDTIQFLNTGTVNGIKTGDIIVSGRDEQGAVIAHHTDTSKRLMPKTVWVRDSHNTQVSGTLLLKKFLPGRDFPSPKSLYAVEDAVRFFVQDKPGAVILDFFGGSGTTCHAVARLNHHDDGRRQSIIVTNNEVSETTARTLRLGGYSPGDPEWEEHGIFENITRPRITAAVTGRNPDGEDVGGRYRFRDESPMSDGFEENVEFFRLTYLDAGQVEVGRSFAMLASLLWLSAGASGPIIADDLDAKSRKRPYVWTDQYGVLFNTDAWRSFVMERPKTATTAYVVTDSPTEFTHIAGELPGHLDVVRLYEQYLTTFGRRGR